MFKPLFSFIMLFFLFSDIFSQSPRIESKIISTNKLKEKKIYCFLFNQDQKDSISFLIYSVKYNNIGYPIVQIRFKEDGKMSDKFVSEYQSDSLESKRISYDSENNISKELIYKYDSKGNLVYRKDTDKNKGVSHEQFFEFDSSKHISKNYNLIEDQKILTGTHEYDKNWKKIKDTYYKPTGEIYNIFLTEYDSSNNSVKSFSLKSDIKTLHTEKIYNSQNFLIEEINYYNSSVKLWDFNGMVENYKKGDKKEVKYMYNDKGLIYEETQILNNKLVSRIKYEYL